MSRAYFVTGTDTGIGKTTVSCALLRAFTAQGKRAVGMKLVASGCRREGGRLVSEDVELLQSAGNVAAPPELANPYAFEPPLAPHIAAARAGVEMDMEVILSCFKKLQSLADIVVVEGVGGFRVPLTQHADTADMAVRLGLPVILVVGMRLGCLNQALLTVEAIAHRGLVLAGWVANFTQAEAMDAVAENIATLQQKIQAPLLGILEFQAFPDVANAHSLLHLDVLRNSDV